MKKEIQLPSTNRGIGYKTSGSQLFTSRFNTQSSDGIGVARAEKNNMLDYRYKVGFVAVVLLLTYMLFAII